MADWLEQLASLATPQERRAFLGEPQAALPPDAVEQIHATLLTRLYSDLPSAARLADACEALADIRRDPMSAALAARSTGHVLHLKGNHDAAVQSYEKAARLFELEGAAAEVGRTFSSGLQALSYLGRYEQAYEWADRAEEIFLSQGDVLRLGRLDSNVGNICFRQDRPRDALVRYQRALDSFRSAGSATDTVAVLSNLAVCHTNLGDFPQALDCYRQARQHAADHGLAVLAAQADYNIAFLHHQRGDYREARRLYQLSRERCSASGDAYHDALCDLDEAEMNLELNLTAEGEELARSAAKKFESLGMRYERAKALVSLAVAGSQRGDRPFADRTLRAARRLFAQESNAVWSALVDQLRAVLAFHDSRFDQAHRLSTAAWRVLAKIMVPGRAAHSQILLARLWLRAGHADRARAVSREAVELMGEDISPSLRFHASLLEGEIHESQGKWTEAWACYQSSRREIEDLRGRVETEDLRISVLKDKVTVYENLIAMCVNPPVASLLFDEECALELVQEAKSRSLADRTRAPLAAGFEDLNWLYRQIEAAKESGVVPANLYRRARELEQEIQRHNPEPSRSPEARRAKIQELRAAVPEGAALLEFFEARGALYAFVVSRETLRHCRLGSSTPSRQAARLLQFQLGKFRLGPEARLHPGSSEAVEDHLRELHALLIAPLEEHLSGYTHLILAPHRYLHGLPFAALNDGTSALIDRFTLSTIPSSDVFLNCRKRAAGACGRTVVMAVPDTRAPAIAQEAEEVSAILSESTLLSGETATVDAFRLHAPSARILHLATHGFFRRDNPMYSAIQLFDGKLSLTEILQIRIASRLLTLSACNTGSNVAVGADELLGLMRGFLMAGARSLLLALWEIDDSSTSQFMHEFYTQLNGKKALPVAFAAATRALREQYPHPYYWAPFLLVGDPEALND